MALNYWTSIHSPQGAPQSMNEFTSPTAVAFHKYESSFVCDWKAGTETQRKMRFYRSVKGDIREQHYLSLSRHLLRLNIAKIWSSSHDLKPKGGAMPKKIQVSGQDHVDFVVMSPTYKIYWTLFFEGTITKTKEHCLSECPMYPPARSTRYPLGQPKTPPYAKILQHHHELSILGRILKIPQPVPQNQKP